LSTSVSHRPNPGRLLAFRIDLVLILSALAAAGIGVVLVYSATRYEAATYFGVSPHYFVVRQAAYVVVGVVVMVVLAALDYRWLEHASAVLYVAMILALLATFAVGQSTLGATRWIQLGPVQIQPSSFASLVLIVVVATFCARRPQGLDAVDIAKVLGLAAVPLALVVKQPDLGSGIVMSVILLVMLVVAGIPNRYLVLLLVLAALGVLAVVHLHLLKGYQLTRITQLFHSSKNLQSTGYNVSQSVAAIGSGGMWGTGLFHGSQTNLAYVPEQQTDFIFSALGEQLGFVGAAGALALVGLLCWRLLRSAQLAHDSFGRLLATGCFTLIAFSVFENGGMTMQIMPVAGIPFPFLSYGGSATVAFFAAVGIALSVRLRAQR
jgi:rod shape determining protein RodA